MSSKNGAAAITVISEQTYKTVLLQLPPLQVSNLQLRTYTGEKLKPSKCQCTIW